ncbi:MAG: hypothetical protein L0Y50_02240 [Beijerinckiaceae bacterium]|nr:hypothetical protein [Beijerinckiaceae bacterium]
MNKRELFAFTLAAALCAGPAFAAQNVANTSQKGSLLIFPLINVEPEVSANTLIEISNDANFPIHIECYYVNENKGRVDFDFNLTPKQTASWEVKTGTGNIAAPLFPTEVKRKFGSIYKGELICFATDDGVRNQVAFNHLTGTATVVKIRPPEVATTTPTGQPKLAFRYNAWAFIARGAGGVGAANGTIQGTPGRLELTGGGAGTYDACPVYNIGNFMPNGAVLNSVKTIGNSLSGVSCFQDLRQDFKYHTTKLHFIVWNDLEHSFTGAYKCVDSVFTVGLNGDGGFVNGTNFDFSRLQTRNARFQVRGLKSTQCDFFPFFPTENTALLGVLASSVGIGESSGKDQTVASTTHTAGASPGRVEWDPRGPVPQKPK